MRSPAGSRFPPAGRGGGLACECGGRCPHVPPRRRAGGRRGAPLCPAAPDCALSPAAGGQSPGRKSAPRPGQAPGPPPQRGPSRHPPRRRRRPPPPPSAPPAPPFSAQDIHQVSCRSGRRTGGGEGCGSSWRGPYPSQIPLASSAPDVPGSLNPKRIRAARVFRSAFGDAVPGHTGLRAPRQRRARFKGKLFGGASVHVRSPACLALNWDSFTSRSRKESRTP